MSIAFVKIIRRMVTADIKLQTRLFFQLKY
nr:MAG TPA: hypothetical protein [Caudoviricetes sp.]